MLVNLDYLKTRAIGVVIGGGLLSLCACAAQASPTVTPTDAPLPARTAVAPRTTLLVPTSAPPPSPPPSIKPTSEPPIHTPTVTDHGPSAATGRTVTDRLPSAADLAIQVGGPAQVVPGRTTIYTLTVHNRGPAPATSILITDDLPTGVIPVWFQPAQPLCGRQGRDVRCDVGGLRDGDAVTATLDLSVGGTDTSITGTQLAGVAWDLSAPTCAIEYDPTSPHLTCRLTSLPPGADAQMRIGVDVDARTTGALVHTATVGANEADANRSNNRAAFTMTVGAAGPVLSEVEGPVAVTAVPTTADLVLQADGPSSVIAGQPFTYTFTITNRGTLDATGVRFENVVPPATMLDDYAPGPPLCEQRDDALTCTLRDPDSGETVAFTLVITGRAGQPMIIELDPLMPGWPICAVLKERPYLHILNCELGALKRGQATNVQLALTAMGVRERMMTNTASVSANEADLNLLDNTNTTTIAVQVRADLLVRSAISGPAVAGETLSYTLTAVNLGPSDADVILTDTLPMGTRLISAASSRGDDCRAEREDLTTDTIVCKLGRLSGGETATVAIVVAVDESLTLVEKIFHSARVVAEQADPNPGNNELTQSIPVSSGVGD